MKLKLAREGIFPITQGKDGRLLESLPASGFSFSGTIQGEGKWSGTPSLFIRLSGCNLHCSWLLPDGKCSPCDTRHAAWETNESYTIPVEEAVDIIMQNKGNIKHLVITGGEPFLQAPALTLFCKQLKAAFPFRITVETNATCFDRELSGYIDLFSLSPKLKSSSPPAPWNQLHERLRLQPEVIRQFIDYANTNDRTFQLKFVYAAASDISEITALLSELKGWENEDILLMPLGSDQEELQQRTQETLAHCIRNGWRYCERLHISLFGNKQGV